MDHETHLDLIARGKRIYVVGPQRPPAHLDRFPATAPLFTEEPLEAQKVVGNAGRRSRSPARSMFAGSTPLASPGPPAGFQRVRDRPDFGPADR